MDFPIYAPYEDCLQKVSFSVFKIAEVLWCLAWVNLQSFLGCPACVNLQQFYNALLVILLRFYNALLVSIYRDYTLPSLCQFTKILMDKISTEKLCKCKFLNCQQYLFPLTCMSRDKIYNHFVNIQEINNGNGIKWTQKCFYRHFVLHMERWQWFELL